MEQGYGPVFELIPEKRWYHLNCSLGLHPQLPFAA